jgi:hypothetical protein
MAVPAIDISGKAEPEPTETTSLLRRDGHSNPSSSGSVTPIVTGPSSISSAPEPNYGIVGGSGDVEAGELREPAVNPMFEGDPEMLAKMHLLFPALAIGVCDSILCNMFFIL